MFKKKQKKPNNSFNINTNENVLDCINRYDNTVCT